MEWWQELIKDAALLLVGAAIAFLSGRSGAREQREHDRTVRREEAADRERLAEQERFRALWTRRLEDTRIFSSSVVIVMMSAALGVESPVKVNAVANSRSALQLLGSDNLVREFGAVQRMLVAQIGHGLNMDQHRRVGRLQAAVLTALNEQETRVANNIEPLLASTEAVAEAEPLAALVERQAAHQEPPAPDR